MPSNDYNSQSAYNRNEHRVCAVTIRPTCVVQPKTEVGCCTHALHYAIVYRAYLVKQTKDTWGNFIRRAREDRGKK